MDRRQFITRLSAAVAAIPLLSVLPAAATRAGEYACTLWHGGRVVEHMVWDRMLTDDEIAQVSNYLHRKYGLTNG